MASFEAMCEGYLGIGAHWNLFQYIFRFTCLRGGSRTARIGCANLRTKQGRNDDYIPVMLTSSNSGWHKGWFYLRKDPECALPSYTGCSIAKRRGTRLVAPPRRSRRRCSSFIGPAGASAKCRNHSGISDRAVPCPRSRAAPEVPASPLRYDGQQSPWVGTVTTGDREIDLLVAAVADASDAPQHGDREICKLSVFSACFIHPLSSC
jgi:hypothetical protein